jgi:hypothetical protein
MRIESRRFRRMYNDFRGRVAVRNVDSPTTIFPSQSRVPSEQPPPGCLLLPQALIPSITSIACAYYGEEESYSGNELCGGGGGGNAVADAGRIVVIEGEEGIVRVSEGRLCSHVRPSVIRVRRVSCRAV